MMVRRWVLYGFVAITLVWLMTPIIIVFPMSFSATRFLTFPPPAWSVQWYEAYLGSDSWMQATKASLIIAVASSVIATVVGTAAAYALNMSASRLTRMLQIVLLLPLVVPIIIIAVAVFIVYAHVGLLATLTGLILANVMLSLPYVVTSVLVGLRKFDPAQEMVSRSLGMDRFRTFFIVTLPQIKASVISGMLFSFISGLDETVIAIFISGGEYQPLTKRMFMSLRDEIDPTIASISTILTATSFLVVLLAALNAKASEKPSGNR